MVFGEKEDNLRSEEPFRIFRWVLIVNRKGEVGDSESLQSGRLEASCLESQNRGTPKSRRGSKPPEQGGTDRCRVVQHSLLELPVQYHSTNSYGLIIIKKTTPEGYFFRSQKNNNNKLKRFLMTKYRRK